MRKICAGYWLLLTALLFAKDPGGWFDGGRRSSPHFTYTARSETGNKVLLMAAENYTAGVPAYPDTTGPNYLTYYTDALDANGVGYDIYDVDRRGNRSPDWLGVLSHYDAVIWYTGDDDLTRQPGQMPGTGTARLRECRVSSRDTHRKLWCPSGAYQTGDAHGTPCSSAVASTM